MIILTEETYLKKKAELAGLRRDAGKLLLEHIRLSRTDRQKHHKWWVIEGNLNRYARLWDRVQRMELELRPYEFCHGIASPVQPGKYNLTKLNKITGENYGSVWKESKGQKKGRAGKQK
jgi:hypothetical protein